MKKLKFVSGRTNDEHTHSLSNTQVNEEMTYNRVMLTHHTYLIADVTNQYTSNREVKSEWWCE